MQKTAENSLDLKRTNDSIVDEGGNWTRTAFA